MPQLFASATTMGAHGSAKAAEILPRYSLDPNPIEMAFPKLRALLHRIVARTYDDLWKAVGNVCRLFTPRECMNHLVATGYDRH